MANIKGGGFRLGVDKWFDKTYHFVDGLVSTDGVQESSVASFGTTAVDILTTTIDPGYTVRLDKIQFGATYRIYGLNGSFVGSVYAYWRMQSKNFNIPSGGFLAAGSLGAVNIAGTYQHTVATYKDAPSYSEFSLSGYINVGSVPYAPLEVKLTCNGVRAGIAYARVKNSSFVRLVGHTVPGT